MNYKITIAAGAAAVMFAVSMAANTTKKPPRQREGPPPSSAVGQNNIEAQSTSLAAAIRSTPHNLPKLSTPPEKPQNVHLWQPPDDAEAGTEALVDGNRAQRLQADPKLLRQLHVGQHLRFHLPQINRELSARLTSTYNQTNSVHVWQGVLTEDHVNGRVLITRGVKDTHVVLSTQDGTYSAVIDNATGVTLLVDEGDINANQIPYEDGIPVPPQKDIPPPESRD